MVCFWRVLCSRWCLIVCFLCSCVFCWMELFLWRLCFWLVVLIFDVIGVVGLGLCCSWWWWVLVSCWSCCRCLLDIRCWVGCWYWCCVFVFVRLCLCWVFLWLFGLLLVLVVLGCLCWLMNVCWWWSVIFGGLVCMFIWCWGLLIVYSVWWLCGMVMDSVVWSCVWFLCGWWCWLCGWVVWCVCCIWWLWVVGDWLFCVVVSFICDCFWGVGLVCRSVVWVWSLGFCLLCWFWCCLFLCVVGLLCVGWVFCWLIVCRSWIG